jgi:CheY-like chemotaxis protein
MDGLEATRRIRLQETNSGHHTPILALTAHAMKGDREMCRKAGMDAYLTKPLSKRLLLKFLYEHCPVPTAAPQPSAAVAAVPDPSAVIDLAQALEGAGGDAALLRELCAVFLRESPRLTEDLLRALQREDAELACRLAHQLKHSAATLAAHQVQARAGSIEVNAAERKLHELSLAVAPLKREIRELRKAVKSFLQASEPAAPASLPVPSLPEPILFSRPHGRDVA